MVWQDICLKSFLDQDNSINTVVMGNDVGFEIYADIPGVEKKDVDISLVNQTLTVRTKRNLLSATTQKVISGQRKSGESSFAYKLNFEVVESDITAELNLGVLLIKIPKSKKSVKKIELI